MVSDLTPQISYCPLKQGNRRNGGIKSRRKNSGFCLSRGFTCRRKTGDRPRDRSANGAQGIRGAGVGLLEHSSIFEGTSEGSCRVATWRYRYRKIKKRVYLNSNLEVLKINLNS